MTSQPPQAPPSSSTSLDVAIEIEEYTVAEDDDVEEVDVEDDDDDDEEEEDDCDDDDEYEEVTVYDDAPSTRTAVVLYHHGATPLFLKIEESDWHAALKVLETESGQKQVRTWVQSTGTKATTFEWSLWRRLPLHEACRRQPPAWFVSRLLSIDPDGASQRTQFGELPLHLAVECGAAPEVVNLLVVAHWSGIAATDQSGRSPLDMLHEAELLCVEDHKVVYESLTRSQQTWDALQQQHATHIKQLQREHKLGLQAVCQQHEQDLSEEFQQHQDLLEQVQHLTLLLERLQAKSTGQQERIDSFEQVETLWRQRVETLERQHETAQLEIAGKKDEVANLARVMVQKNRRIQALETEVALLKGDLAASSAMQQQLAQHVAHTEHDLHQLVSGFCRAQDLLAAQHKDLRHVLHQRGAQNADLVAQSPLWQRQLQRQEEEQQRSIRLMAQTRNPQGGGSQSKHCDDNDEDPAEKKQDDAPSTEPVATSEEAFQSAAAAASTALQHSNSSTSY